MRHFKTAALAVILIIILAAAGCSTGASAQGGGLVISEVVTSNSNSLVDPILGKPDWVELCNTSKSPIDITGYSISESKSKKFDFPEMTVAPGQYIMVYFCDPVDGASPDLLCTGFKLSKSGMLLTLSSSSGRIQDLTVPELVTDVSYGLDSAGGYAYFGIPTPGAPNTTQSFTELSALESDKNVQLKINEVLPKSHDDAQPYAWAEVYNAGANPVELSDYYISENPSNPNKARMPEKLLGPGEYALLNFTGGSGEGEVPFKISSTETSLTISNNFGYMVDSFSWDKDILPGLSAGPGASGAVYYTDPTPGAANGDDGLGSITLSDGVSSVRINEVLLKNTFSLIDADGNRSPWVELYNASGSSVSLADYALSDSGNDLWKWSLPAVDLAPDSYLVVYLSGKDRKEGELHTSFQIGGDESALYLTDISAGKVQTAALPENRQNNVSYGLSNDGSWLYYPQPTPGARNDTQGFEEIAYAPSPPQLKINEVVSVNAAKSGKSDWVELYNGTSSEINLSGYFLSDTNDDLNKWPIGSVKIKSGGYAVINSYEKDGAKQQISISPAGEKLFLTNPDGDVVDTYDSQALRAGFSSGINADGTEAIFDNSTPGKVNSGGTVQGYCAAPVFSEDGGYKSKSFSLTMTTTTPGAHIYYTTDGSTPKASSAEYTGPITVKGNDNVRAVAVAEGMLNSDETVATYIFDKPHSLPVVCLSMTKSDLNYVFGSQNRDDQRERAGYVEYYESSGTLGVRFPAGFRIAGAGTRTARQKSINLYLRGGYGLTSITYPFFDGYDLTTFKSLSLRNMGAWQDPTRLKDVFFSMAADGLNVDNAQAKFAVVYINGAYWGLYEFKENQNEDYLAAKHGIDPDKVVMVRGNKYNVETGHSDKDIVSLYSLAKKDMDDAENFDKYTSLADSDYFMDYLIAETFFYCYDTYNQKFAHTTDNTLKWRPLLYDFDISMKSSSGNVFGVFFRDQYIRHDATSNAPAGITDMSLYFAFYKNDQWKKRFIERYAEVLNTTMTNEKLLALYDELTASIKSEIPLTAAKWKYPSSTSAWNSSVKSFRKILENRRKYVLKQLLGLADGYITEDYIKSLFPNDKF